MSAEATSLAGISVGIDIGGTSTKAVLLDDHDAVLAFHAVPTERGPAGVVRSAEDAVRAAARTAGLAASTFDRVGVGVPGAVDPRTGVVRDAVNLDLDASGFDLGVVLSGRFGAPVHVENDVKAAAVGAEHIVAAALGRSPDLAYLRIGTGIAAGFVVAGELRRGTSLIAGEIGHFPIDPAGPTCACGQTGCIEAISSGTAIDRVWPTSGGSAASALAAAAAAGDPAAVDAWTRVIGGLGSAIVLLTLTMDPEVIVLGGGVAELGEPLVEAIAAHLGRAQHASPFLESLTLGSRLRILDGAVPVGAIGAVRAARNGVRV